MERTRYEPDRNILAFYARSYADWYAANPGLPLTEWLGQEIDTPDNKDDLPYLERCLDVWTDGALFNETCMWIAPKDMRSALLVNNPMQNRLQQIWDEEVRLGLPHRWIIGKSRQKGGSTWVAAKYTEMALTHYNAHIAVVADEADKAENIFGFYRLYYDQLHPKMQPEVRSERMSRHLWFDQLRSTIQVFVPKETKSAIHGKLGRSHHFHFVHYSEAAFYDNPVATMTSMNRGVPRHPNTAIIQESTANGSGNAFHQDWMAAAPTDEYGRGKSGYRQIFVSWYCDDEYTKPFAGKPGSQEYLEDRERFLNDLRNQENSDYGNEVRLLSEHEDDGLTPEHLHWRREEVADMRFDNQRYKVEYPSDADEMFQESGGNWLNGTIMSMYSKRQQEPIRIGDFAPPEGYDEVKPYGEIHDMQPRFVERPDGYVHLYRESEPDCEFIGATDTAQGNDTGDFNAGLFKNRTEGVYVCEVRGRDYRRIKPRAFADQMFLAALYYNHAHLLPESTYGRVVISRLVDELDYPNVMRSKDVRCGLQHLTKNPDKYGWWECVSSLKYAQDTVREWWEGSGSIDEFDPDEMCWRMPIPRVIWESRQCVVVGTKVEAPRKHARRSPNEDEQGVYDDDVRAMFGVELLDGSLDAARPRKQLKMEREIREAMSSRGLDVMAKRAKRNVGALPKAMFQPLRFGKGGRDEHRTR